MERLDELCLMQILGYLRLSDQLSLLQCDDRLYRLLRILWRRQLTKINLNLLQVPLSANILEFLLENTHRELLTIRLNYMDRDQFDVLVKFRFPKLQMLQVDALPPFTICPQRQEQLRQVVIMLEPEDQEGSFGKVSTVKSRSRPAALVPSTTIPTSLQVCIVQKRDSGTLYAMKYVSRSVCESRGALGGVIKEVELLSSLEHPFLVNLWFSFQDEEDLFMVCDLLTGGDLRYHLQNRVEFSEKSVALLVCELGSALEYLQSQRVIHRDIKPDNILLDDAGHAHLTDFNIATRLQKDSLACSMSGTKPYMAPEVFMCALEEVAGYSYPVDWWSLGVVAYEMRSNTRPFVLHSHTPLVEIKNVLNTSVHYPHYWSHNFIDLLQKLLCVHPGARISTQQELHQTPLLRPTDFQAVLDKKIKPIFKPPEDHLNCDPCLELEEMIVETRPLHKKKKRLAKQRSAQRDSDPETTLIKEFIVYNRFKELKRKAMEQKESDWQRELELAMANSIVNSLAPIQEKPTTSLATTDTPTAQALSACARCTGGTTTKPQPKDSDSIEFIDRTPSPQ
ncbi:hypothetical protein KR222_004417, partial [Zaprionus bogoriensis]